MLFDKITVDSAITHFCWFLSVVYICKIINEREILHWSFLLSNDEICGKTFCENDSVTQRLNACFLVRLEAINFKSSQFG